jgi:hypothetical protein
MNEKSVVVREQLTLTAALIFVQKINLLEFLDGCCTDVSLHVLSNCSCIRTE